MRVQVNLTGNAPNEYTWDLRNVDRKINAASDDCYTRLDFRQTGTRCVLCNLTKEGEYHHLARLLKLPEVYVDQTDQANRTALTHARDVKTAALLLAAGANSSHRDYENRSVLWWFDRRNDYEMIKLLLAAAAEPGPPDAAHNTLLHHRAQRSDGNYNSQIIMKKYLAHGLAVDAVNAAGATPLMLAAARGQPALYDFFLATGAAVTVRTPAGENLLHWAYAQNPTPEDYGLIADLVARGVPINAPDATGALPIHKAVAQGAVGRVKALLAAGSKYHGQTAGHSLLHTAVQIPGNKPIAELLLTRGLDLNERTVPTGDTPLMLAIRSNDYALVEFLLAQKARTDTRNAAKQNAYGVARRAAYALIAEQKAAVKKLAPGVNSTVIEEEITRQFHARRQENRKIINLLKPYYE